MITCPACGRECGGARSFNAHWGGMNDDAHAGPTPDHIDTGDIHFSKEHRRNISEAKMGETRSEAHREAIAETLRGNTPWNKGLTKEDDDRVAKYAKSLTGKNHSPERVRANAERVKRAWEEGKYDGKESSARYGEDNHFYIHGNGSIRPGYPPEFSEELREQIRERDGRECQVCAGGPAGDLERLDVHHIDCDKENNDPENLVALCRPCHMTMEYTDEITQRMMYRADPETGQAELPGVSERARST